MSDPIDPHSATELHAMLTDVQQTLHRGELEEAADRLGDILLQDELWQPSSTQASAARVQLLERELRFAIGLVALLFLTGVWGFWRSALYERTPPRASSQSAGAPAGAGGAPVPPALPAPQARADVVGGQNPATLSRQALLPRAVLAPSQLRRPAYRRKAPGVRSGVSPITPLTKRASGAARRRKARRRIQHKTPSPPTQGKQVRRPLRFGDPASPSEVPPQWCGRRLRYGLYFPCLKRANRRCVKRSKRQRYGCLRR